MKSAVIIVSGKVQHKGFRFTAMQVAYQRGIRGFIKNDRGGTLYIEAEGEDEQLDGFIEWCRHGSIWSTVTDIEVKEGEFQGFTSFDIR
jgi:acylphosphatase